MFLDAFQSQLYPIVAIIVLSFIVGAGTWILRLFGGARKSNKEVSFFSNRDTVLEIIHACNILQTCCLSYLFLSSKPNLAYVQEIHRRLCD